MQQSYFVWSLPIASQALEHEPSSSLVLCQLDLYQSGHWLEIYLLSISLLQSHYHLGVVWYGIPYCERHIVYRTKNYGMTKHYTDTIPNFSVYRSSVYQKFGKVVFDTVTIPYFRYIVPHSGIPYFALYRTAVQHTIIPVIPKKNLLYQKYSKYSSVQLIQKV